MKTTRAQRRRDAILAVMLTLWIANAAAAETAASAAAPPPSAAPPPPPQPAANASPPENIESLAPGAAVAILGKKVRDASGHDMGPVVDVVVSGAGHPLAAVIDFGGFLGVGTRKIAIDWSLLQFKPADQDAPVVLALDRALVQVAPEYKPAAQLPVQIVGPPAPPGNAGPTDKR
jgi:hypothetical protein